MPNPSESRRNVAFWLFAMCAMVYIMVVLGGVTRLTESGLSMVQWKPLVGWIPPMSHADWQALFDKYRQFPEYEKKHLGMTLAGFKGIFWLEYFHRLWGRLIGLAFLLPFLWFVARGRIGRSLRWPLAGLFLLGAAQGFLGWYMVESGLVDRPTVSQYRLAAHLAVAVIIYLYMLWLALSLSLERDVPAPPSLCRAAAGIAVLAFVTMLSGAIVAGLDAGMTYNTFPLMDGRLVPRGYWAAGPLSPFQDIATVQFNHRVLGIATAASIAGLWLCGRRFTLATRARRALNLLAAMVLVQAGLGVATLLTVVAIPLAALHQAGAVMVLTLAVWLMFELGVGRRAAVRMRPASG